MIQIDAPDGSVVEFPEGTSSDTIQKVMRQNFGGPPTAAFEPTQRRAEDVSMAKLASNPPDMTPPSAITQATGGYVNRNEFELMGGMGGAALGAPSGPMGIVAGGALGAAAGGQAYDLAEQGFRALTGRGIPHKTLSDAFSSAMEDATLDAAFSMGAGALGKVYRVSSNGFKRWLATDRGRELSQKAAEMGLDLGIFQTTESKVVQGYQKVIGRLPLMSRPFQKTARGQYEALPEVKDRLFFRVGPSVGMAQLGTDMNQWAKGSFKWFRAEANRRYSEAMNLAEERGVRVPIENGIKKIDEIAERLEKRRPQLAEGDGQVPASENAVQDFIQQHRGLLADQTVHNYDGIMENLDVAMSKAKDQGWSLRPLVEIKQAFESDLLKMYGDEEAIQLFRDADEFYANTSKLFETPTAQRFGRITKGAFRLGLERPGTRNVDETFDVVWNAKSPDAVSDLHELLTKGRKGGQQVFDMAVRRHLDNAWNRGVEKDGGINVDSVRKYLGLHNPYSREYAVLDKALTLNKSGVRPQNIKDFLDVVEAAFGPEIPQSSTFLARRMVFTGLGGLAGGSATTAAGIGSFGVVPALAYLGSHVLAKPRVMRAVKDVIAAGDQQKVQALARLIREVPEAYQNQKVLYMPAPVQTAVNQAKVRAGRQMANDIALSVK